MKKNIFDELDKLYRECNYEFSQWTHESFWKTEEKFIRKMVVDYGFSIKTAKDFIQWCEIEDSSNFNKVFKDNVLLTLNSWFEDEEVLSELQKTWNLIKTFENLWKPLARIEQKNSEDMKEYILKLQQEDKEIKKQKLKQDIINLPKNLLFTVRQLIWIFFIFIGFILLFTEIFLWIFTMWIWVLIFPDVKKNISKLKHYFLK